jgi:hypothetical protein
MALGSVKKNMDMVGPYCKQETGNTKLTLAPHSNLGADVMGRKVQRRLEKPIAC